MFIICTWDVIKGKWPHITIYVSLRTEQKRLSSNHEMMNSADLLYALITNNCRDRRSMKLGTE